LAHHFLTPGIRGDHPEYGLALGTALDQRLVSVNRDRAGNIADVGSEQESRFDDRFGGIEGISQRGKMPSGARPAHLGASQQLQQCLIEIDATIVCQKFACRHIPLPHCGVLQTGHEQHMGRHARCEEPGGHLIVARRRLLQRLEMAQDLVAGVFALSTDPLQFGIVFGHRRLEYGQLA
jgi:hypothetical protein